jgi:hypothetical protein
MATYRNSRILPTILTIVVIIIAIVGLVTLARALFFGGSSSTSQITVDLNQKALLDSTDGSAVTMTVRGPIVADENFRSYKIIITPSSRDIKTYTGYLGTVLQQDNLTNNTAAYEEFVHALDKANMSSGKQLTDDKNDVRGICATGRVYEFSILKNADTVQQLWTSTCSGSPGSLKANAPQLMQLFRSQIPSASTLLSGLAI